MDQSEQERCHHRGAGAKKRKATSQKGCLSSKAPLSTRHSIPYTYLDILFLFAIFQPDIFLSTNFGEIRNLTCKRINSVFIFWQQVKTHSTSQNWYIIRNQEEIDSIFGHIWIWICRYIYSLCFPLPSPSKFHYFTLFTRISRAHLSFRVGHISPK